MNIIYQVGKENQAKLAELHKVKAAVRKPRPMTAKEERFKFHRTKVDVLD